MKLRILSTLGAAFAAVLVASCGETTNEPPSQLNLDRPVDIAFACWGGLRFTHGETATIDHLIDYSAQPIASCDKRTELRKEDPPNSGNLEPVHVPPGQENLTQQGGLALPGVSYYGFILQSARGTVAIAEFPPQTQVLANADPLVNVKDADELTPGKNGISVGEDPIAITTDKIGCYEVVANAGSCDLSALDIGSALDSNDSDVRVDRIPIVNAAGEEMLARPAAMVGDVPGGEIGFECPMQPTGIVYVAYPACHLVAAVDSSNGTIVAGIDYSSGTPTITDGNVSCPAECGGGGTFTAGVRPVALDIKYNKDADSTRLVIGAENSSQLTIVNLGADSLPASLQPLLLEDTQGGDMGVTAVALGPQIGAGGRDGVINDDIATGGQFQFVYAIATDGSIRVADVLDINSECDTNVDPRLIDDVTSVRDLSCFPVGAPTTPARRANARGPGIRLPATYHDVIPTSLEIHRVSNAPNDGPTHLPAHLVGYFTIVTASNGSVYVIDVDDDDSPDYKDQGSPMAVQLPLAISHHLRDAIPGRNFLAEASRTDPGDPDDPNDDRTEVYPICSTNGPDPDAQSGNAGGVRSTANPTRNVPSGFVSAEKVTELPSIRQVQCIGEDASKNPDNRVVSELSFAAPAEVRDLVYQDLISLLSENWTATYEGPLSVDTADTDVDGPPIRVAQVVVDTLGMHLEDAAKPFCEAGVEQWDIVQMRGCDPQVGDAQCPIGYRCFVHPNSEITGLGACMLADEADRLADACKDFLTTSRRYTVGRSESGELNLLPRKRQLAQTPLDGCVDTDQCTMLADYAKKLASSAHPVEDMTEPNARKYECRADPDRPPLDGPGQTGKRCIEVCTQSSDCSTGAVCREGVCMEGVIPPQSCVNAPQRYELRAHDAFTMIGSRSGYIHSMIRDAASDRCVRDPAAHPFEIGRIPLAAPACDPTADLRTGRRPDGTFEPNPCSTTVDQVENVPNYVPNTCTLGDPASVTITRQAPAIRFRNRGFMIHLVDPTYPGDAVCNKDMAGALGNVPTVFPNYQLAWRQTAGLTPFTLNGASAGLRPAYPVRVVSGPTESIWIVDQGDYLSTSVTEPSTRGKVYRIEGQALGKLSVLQ